MALGSFILVLFSYKFTQVSGSFCDIITHGYGFHDPGLDYVSIQLNGHHAYHLVNAFMRGIHVGLINITSCALVDEPVLCDFYGSGTANGCFQDAIAEYSTQDHDTLIVMATGKYLCLI